MDRFHSGGEHQTSSQLLVSYQTIPIASMYGIFTGTFNTNQQNVGKYTIHGCYGNRISWGI